MIKSYVALLSILFFFSLSLSLSIYQVILILCSGLLFLTAHYLFFAKALSFPNTFASISMFIFCFTMPNLCYVSDDWWLSGVKDLQLSPSAIIFLSIRFLVCLILLVLFCRMHSILYLKSILQLFHAAVIHFLVPFRGCLIKLLRFISLPPVVILICVFISLVRLFAFSLSIGITGLDPTPLPFKATGLIVFFLSFAPLLLSYLLLRTRSNACTVLILLCASINSILGASKFQVFLPFTAFLYQLFVDMSRYKYRLQSVLSFALCFFLSVFLLSTVNALKSNLVVSDSLGNRNLQSLDNSILEVFRNLDNRSFSSAINASSAILSRFDSIEGIFLASTYNPYNVTDGQPANRLVIPFARFLFKPDPEDHHLEWIGQSYIRGFYLGGGLLSELFIMLQASPVYFLLFSNIVAFVFVIVDALIRSLNLPWFHTASLYTIFSFVAIADIGGIWFYCCLALLPPLFYISHHFARISAAV